MGSLTPIKLPQIDFSKIYSKESTPDDWNSVKTQVHQALTEYGFFRGSISGITPEFLNSLFGSIDQLFDLPLETKLKTFSDKPFHGYIGRSPTMQLYESMAIPDAPVAGKVEAFTNFFWPDGNPVFRESIRNISDKMYWIDQIARKMILESLGLEKYSDDHMDNTKHLLRIAKYKEPDTNESMNGLSTHIDKTTLAILYHNEVAGLELETRSGEWIQIDKSPHSFTVIIGEVFHAWSNGRLYPPYHRVLMTGNEARYTLGLFSVPKAGYITKVPDELVDEEHPLLFLPFDYDEFLNQIYTGKIGAKDDALGAYCGTNSEITIFSEPISK